MENSIPSLLKSNFCTHLTQVAWVVRDVKAAVKFFKEALGISNFSDPEIICLREFEGTHYGETSDAESMVSMAYSGGTFIELI